MKDQEIRAIKQLLNKKRIGAVLRVFVSEESQIQKRVEMLKKMVETLKSIKFLNHLIVSRVDIMVWNDNRYQKITDTGIKNASDYGKTVGILQREFSGDNKINIHNFKYGDLYCAILNRSLAIQTRNRIDYSLILSMEALEYVTEETLLQMILAMTKGAKVSGVAIKELAESVHNGKIANTFALWSTIDLISVGGFDLMAAGVYDERSASFIKGFSDDEGEIVYYEQKGVEEMIPLARMVDAYGECIAPIDPEGKSVPVWQKPNPIKEKYLWERFIAKMATKLQRQNFFLNCARFAPSFLRGGVMEEYRK